MKAKSKTSPERFLWHLRPPWRSCFSHDHWWKANDGPSRIAALWEVVRRHPHSKGLLQRFGVNAEPNDELEWFIADSAQKSWQALTDGERVDWRNALAHLPPQRGFDPRPVFSVTAQSVDVKDGAPPAAAVTLDTKLMQQAQTGDAEARRFMEGAEQAREAEIARLAVEHHRAGRILLAIEPDVANFEQAIEALTACYAQHHVKADHGRGRVLDWLTVIREFEDAELHPKEDHIRDKTLFLRYHKIIGGVSW